MAFTFQRLLIVTSPMRTQFTSKRSAWITVLYILVVSLAINSWSLFFFKINETNSTAITTRKYCDVNQKLKNPYFFIAITYLIVIMVKESFRLYIYNLDIHERSKIVGPLLLIICFFFTYRF